MTRHTDWLRATVKFDGTGADSALALSSSTTTLDLGGVQVFTKNYTSISITGTGKLAFTNPHANGTIIVLKSQGNVTLTSSTNPQIDGSGIGSSLGNYGNSTLVKIGYGTDGVDSGASSTAGVAGTVPISFTSFTSIVGKFINLGCGAAGGNGAVNAGQGGASGGGGASLYNNGGGGDKNGSMLNSAGCIAGTGSRGGAAIYIECGGNYTASGNITVAGVAGGNATAGTFGAGVGGGGGGGGGTYIVLINGTKTDTSTISLTGGTGGTGYSQNNHNMNGGAGGNGYSLVALNTEFV